MMEISKRTLVILNDRFSRKVLLGFKKRGFGEGKYVGIGGKVETGEEILDASIREVKEEIFISIQPEDLEPLGKIAFRFDQNPSWSQDVYLFLCEQWTGEIAESEEIKPKWFSFDEIPYSEMWDDAKHWVPKALNRERVDSIISFKKDCETVGDIEWL